MVETILKCLSRRSLQSGIALVASAAFVGVMSIQVSLVDAQAAKPTAKKTPVQKADVSRTHALSLRVEELEEQIVDLQVVIGTLESLAKTGGQPSGASFTNGRVAPAAGANDVQMKAQVKALSVQVSKLSAEVSALQQARGGRSIAARSTPVLGPPAPPNTVQGTSIGTGFGATTVSPVQAPNQVRAPDERVDAIGSLIREPIAPVDARAVPPSPTVAVPRQPTPAPSPDPAVGGEAKATYDQAYGDLLQQDFANAQSGFRSFLRQFPQHALVPNALYWLGETYYVQQNYTDAAEAFDIVTAAYARSNKAPDSQLKRGMSLANLGKRSEACTVFRSLAKRYPNAPAHVKSKADSERQRVGCT